MPHHKSRPAHKTSVSIVAILVTGCLAVAPHKAFSQDSDPVIRNNFGGVGLIDMPSARMAPEGELSGGASFFKNTQHYNFAFQATPWLEANFRYTGLDHFDPAYPVYYDRSFAMKARFIDEGDFRPAVAIGVNDVVGTGIYSSEYIVASKRFGAVDATLGIGWGRLGEAATFENPLTLISDSFRIRNPGGAAGGTTFGNLFHGIKSGIFGGLTWNTPVDGLTLISEFSSDKYSVETSRGNFDPSTQINLGANYQVADYFNVGLSWVYGKSIALNLAFSINPLREAFPEKLGPPPSELPTSRSIAEQLSAIDRLRRKAPAPRANADNGKLVDAVWQAAPEISNVTILGSALELSVAAGNPGEICSNVARLPELYRTGFINIAVTGGLSRVSCSVSSISEAAPARMPITPITDPNRFSGVTNAAMVIDARGPAQPNFAAAGSDIRREAQLQNITILNVIFSGGNVTVYYSNGRYFRESDAINRLVRILMLHAPLQIERFHLIAMDGGMALRQFEILRTPLERNLDQTGDLGLQEAVVSEPAPIALKTRQASGTAPYPRFSWQIFPQFRQELFDPSNPFGVQFVAGVSGSVEMLPGFSITGEAEASIWDNFSTGRASDSVLPHVRTDFLKYFGEGKNGIGDLEGDYRFRLAPNVFAIARAGYLESMFAGIGGEVLWRPDGWRWALGADLYWVKQREFDRLFGLQPYQVTTGHFSLYYSSPWYDLEFALRAGQYLAGDKGLTLEVSRRFKSGVQIGAFMTRTNVSAQDFGEGSFDKGIIIRIPVGWSLPINTQNEFSLQMRPVQRDGGQRLGGDALLYEETRRTSESEMKGFDSR